MTLVSKSSTSLVTQVNLQFLPIPKQPIQLYLQVMVEKSHKFFLEYTRIMPMCSWTNQPLGFQQFNQEKRGSNMETLIANYIKDNDGHLTLREEIMRN